MAPGAIVDYQNLPAEGQGFKYFWLGNSSDPSVINDSLITSGAFDDVGLTGHVNEAQSFTSTIGQAQSSGKAAIPGMSTLQQWASSLLQGSLFVPGSGILSAADAASGAGATAGEAGAGAAGSESAGAGATGAEAAGAAAAGVAAGASGLLSDILAFCIRALEVLAGAALLLLGLQAMTGSGDDGNPIAETKRAAKKVGGAVAGLTPEGRAERTVAKAARHEKREATKHQIKKAQEKRTAEGRPKQAIRPRESGTHQAAKTYERGAEKTREATSR